MTADYTYGTYAVYDPITDLVNENLVGGTFVLVKDGPAQPIYDLLGNPITGITSNASGQSSQFRANSPMGLIQFGTTAVTVFANEVAQWAVDAHNAAASAGTDTAAVQAIVRAMLVAGTNVTLPYDTTAKTITVTGVTAALLTNITQAFTGPTNFTSATASNFTTNPTVTVSGSPVANTHVGNLAAQLASSAVIIAYHNLSTQPYTIWANAGSANWPNSGSRVLPDGSSLSTLTVPIYWNSSAVAGLSKPAGFADGDEWFERVS